MAVTSESVVDLCRRARAASLTLPSVTTEAKNEALTITARLLRERTDEILAANLTDLERGRVEDLPASLVDRLSLDAARVEAMAAGVEAVLALPDPVGEVRLERTLPNGIDLRQVSVPIGVIAVFYEARPNVTIDAAALCVKSGNAVLLRGSSSASASNAILGGIVREAVAAVDMPEGTVEVVGGGERAELAELAGQRDLVDLIIPRGGEGLKKALQEVAKVPVLYAASGNCHVYIDAAADLDMGRAIAVNSKVQRPSVCNSAETLLVHRDVATEFMPEALAELAAAGVEIVGDDATRAAAGDTEVGVATEADWDTEYHALKLAVKVVDSLDDAIDHVNRHGSGHSEAIVTESREAGDAFTGAVDTACVYVNASIRFSDGFEFGMGAEIGTSTQKLHARGPIGLRELCSSKYVLRGSGQIRG